MRACVCGVKERERERERGMRERGMREKNRGQDEKTKNRGNNQVEVTPVGLASKQERMKGVPSVSFASMYDKRPSTPL